MALLNPEEKKQIEIQVAEAEKKTSGEIVVSTVHASGDYFHVRWKSAGIGWVVASVVIMVDYYRFRWGFTALGIVAWQAFGAALGGMLSLNSSIGRLLVSRRSKAAHVHHECLAHFTALGMHHTRDHTGILIFISEFERRVEILADSGIHEKAGTDYWREQVDGIIQGLKEGKPAPAISEAIRRMGDKLATHFPPRADDTDEIPNQVRDGNQIQDPT